MRTPLVLGAALLSPGAAPAPVRLTDTTPTGLHPAGIFRHVDGRGATAGRVSVPVGAMRAVLARADPARRTHIAVGTRGGPTAITR
ncbi:hypothetical protein [Streptomyces sp. NPDC004285]